MKQTVALGLGLGNRNLDGAFQPGFALGFGVGLRLGLFVALLLPVQVEASRPFVLAFFGQRLGGAFPLEEVRKTVTLGLGLRGRYPGAAFGRDLGLDRRLVRPVPKQMEALRPLGLAFFGDGLGIVRLDLGLRCGDGLELGARLVDGSGL